MLRCLGAVLLWVLTLGAFTIKIRWEDGWSIHLCGWGGVLR